MKHTNDVVAICLSVALGKHYDNRDIEEPQIFAIAYTELALNQQKYDISASEHFKVMTIIASHYMCLTSANTPACFTKTYELLWSPSFDDFLDRALLYFCK